MAAVVAAAAAVAAEVAEVVEEVVEVAAEVVVVRQVLFIRKSYKMLIRCYGRVDILIGND